MCAIRAQPQIDDAADAIGYKIEVSSTGPNSGYSVVAANAGLVYSYTVTGLTNGTSYQFRVSAVTAAGIGAATEPVLATPATTPSAPTALTTTPGDKFVTLGWVAPSSNGGSAITTYVVEQSTDGTSWSESLRTTALTATVTGLTPRVTYRFRVAAVNVVGTGSFSGIVSGVPSGP